MTKLCGTGQGGVPALSTSSSFHMPPPSSVSSFPPSANHSSVPSQSTFGSSFQSYAMDGTRESEENPAGAYSTRGHLGSFSSSSANANGPRAAGLFPKQPTFRSWFSEMDTDEAATAQVKGDHLIAQLLQHDFGREDEEFNSSWLGGYREQLRSLRCLHCNTPIKLGPAELVQRTKKMLKHDRRSRQSCSRIGVSAADGLQSFSIRAFTAPNARVGPVWEETRTIPATGCRP